MTAHIDMELGTPLPVDPVLEEKLVALLGAMRSGQLLAVSIVVVHRGGVVDAFTSGRVVESIHREAGHAAILRP